MKSRLIAGVSSSLLAVMLLASCGGEDREGTLRSRVAELSADLDTARTALAQAQETQDASAEQLVAIGKTLKKMAAPLAARGAKVTGEFKSKGPNAAPGFDAWLRTLGT